MTEPRQVPVAAEPPTQPAMPPTKPALPKIERATVIEVRPGDVLMFEVDHSMSDKEMASFKEGVREVHGGDVRVAVVERARFAGIIRHAAETPCGLQWLSGEPCPKRDNEFAHECGRPSCHDRDHECRHCGRVDVHHMIEVSTNADRAAGRRIHIPGRPEVKP